MCLRISSVKYLLLAFSLACLPASSALAQDLIITGVLDGPLTGGLPKAIELFVLNNIADLSTYGVGSANNGGGSDGEEFTFPAVSATAGDFIYVATESTGFTDFFGFAPNYTSSAANINGDDAIELFQNGSVVDVFGDINTSGSGQPWEYTDGWAYRNDGTGPDGTTFMLGNWTFSGPNALDGETSNATAAAPFPLGTYNSGGGEDTPPTVTSTVPVDGATAVPVTSNMTITFSEDVNVVDPWLSISCDSGAVPAGFIGGPQSYTIMPDADLPSGESCTLTVLSAQVTDLDGTPDNMLLDFMFSFATAAPVGACGDPTTLMSMIQGTGNASLEVGNVHTIEGVVVGDFQETGMNGFFVQEETTDQDADPLTSEGLFVFSSTAVAQGDIVRVTGEVDEFFNLTELINVSTVSVCSSGNSVPAAILNLPFPPDQDGVPYLERFENMLVGLGSPLTVTENFDHGRFGQLTLSNGRLFQPTHVALPGAPAQAVADANALNRIVIDHAFSRDKLTLIR